MLEVVREVVPQAQETVAAKQLADLASEFETQRTGRTPEAVTVTLADDSLVITLHGVMSLAEKDLAKTLVGADQLREQHRQLFLSSSGSLMQEIEVITGVAVREATSEVAVHTGTVVHVFLLAAGVEPSTWSESTSEIWVAKKLAETASQFETHRTGRVPNSVTAVLIDDTLVITLRGTLSSTETELAKTPIGAAHVREQHRQLFLTSCPALRQEIEVITGVGVLEATSEVATHTGTVVLVFLLAGNVTASTWSETKTKVEPVSVGSPSSSTKPELGGES